MQEGSDGEPERDVVPADGVEDTQRKLAVQSSQSVFNTLERAQKRKRSREVREEETVIEPEDNSEGASNDGVDWVDVEPPDISNGQTENKRSPFNASANGDLVEEDWVALANDEQGEAEEDIIIEVEKQGNVPESTETANSRRVVVSPEERAFFANLHASHLTALIASIPLRADATASNPRVQAAGADLLLNSSPSTLGELRQMVLAFGTRVPIRESASRLLTTGSSNWSLTQRTLEVARQRIGPSMEATTLFTSALRSRGLRTRIVASLWPLSHKPRSDGDEDLKPFRVWCEVYLHDRWIPACPETRTADNAKAAVGMAQSNGLRQNPQQRTRQRDSAATRQSNRRAELAVGKKQPVPVHIVACEHQCLFDVTRRYVAGGDHRVNGQRAPRNVFERTLRTLSTPIDPSDPTYQSECNEFERLTDAEPLPTTLAGFVKHPKFVLERHMGKYEVLHPRKPILGYHAGQPVYPRKNVYLLRSRDRWIREMREVRAEEVPVKVDKVRKGAAREGEALELFGLWQTGPYIVPTAVDGVVPKDSRGKVDVWTPAHVPKGCVHIPLKYAPQMARRLGIDFAPAMTGFDINKGKSVPRYEGAVVCEENKELLEDAARAGMGAKIEEDAQKEFKALVKEWRRIIRIVRAKEMVRRKYGEGAGPVSYDGKAELFGTGEELAKSDVAGQAPITAAHVHKFSDARPDLGDTNVYIQKCLTCGFQHRFEKM